MKTLFYIILFLFSVNLFSQVQFTATSDYSSVPMSTPIKVTYALSGGNAEEFSRPNFSGFRVVGQSTYSGGGGMQIVINGQVIKNDPGESKWIFTLMPQNTGKITIGPAKVRVNGKIYNSNSLTINVTSGGSTVTAPNQQGSKTQTPNTAVNTGGKEIFISAVPSKRTLWLGEQFVVSYKIYSSINLLQYGTEKTPSMDGFWIEELTDGNQKPQVNEEIIDGKRYLVVEVRRVALIPQKTGTLTIPPLELEAIVQIRSQQNFNPFSFFDQFFQDPFSNSNIDPFAGFGVKTEKRTISGNALTVNVKPLPENGKPESFRGAVGSFNVNSSIDRNKCYTGDGIIYKLNVSGAGNLPLIEHVEPGIPESFEWFDPDINDDFSKSANGISGSRSFEFLIQPTVPGDFKIKPVEFSFFNPQSGVYETVNLPEYDIKVLRGSGSNISAEKQLGQDIMHIHEAKIDLRKNAFGFSLLYWLLVLAILLAFVFLLYFYRGKIRLKANVSEYKMRMAMKQAKKRLKNAKIALDRNENEKYYSELSAAMWRYITDKFNIPISDLSLSNTYDVLLKNNVPDETAKEFAYILNECEFARFSSAKGRIEKTDLYNKATELIIKVQTYSKK